MVDVSAVQSFRTPMSTDSSSSHMLPTTSTSKPKFWQMFNWRKSAHSQQQSGLDVGRSGPPSPSLPEQMAFPQTRPTLSMRSKSEHSVAKRSRSTPRPLQRRKKSPTVADPPPLVQAYTQAIIHSTLEVPCSPSERGYSRPSSSSSKEPQDLRTDVKQSHQRTSSRSSVSSLREKLMFLTSTGHILQYEANGHGDRLPEKILELKKEAVAFASDAITGRPWVLQVSSRASIADSSRPPSLKSTRSKLNLRLSEPKRNTETLYLVFEDPEDLYSWLFCVRKEIEGMGGMEYRPDTRGTLHPADRAITPSAHRQSRLTPALNRLSRSSSALPLVPTTDSDSAITGVHLQAPPLQRSVSAQSAASTSTESTSLEKLRDSVLSESYPSTVGTSVCSPKSMSPTQESFSSFNVSPDLNGRPMGLLTSAPVDSVTARMAVLNVSRPTIQERRQMSSSLPAQQEPDKGVVDHNKSLPEPPPPSPDAEKERPVSIVAPLPLPGCLLKSSRPGSRKTSVDEGKNPIDTVQDKPLPTIQKEGRRKSSATSAGDMPKAKYSLFPSPPSVPPVEVMKPSSPPRGEVCERKTHSRGRSRTLTLNLSRAPSVSRLSPTTKDFQKPQRSPAVTIEMIEANFGAAPLASTPSPVTHHRVPSLSEFNLDTSSLNSSSDLADSPPTKEKPRKLSAMKSMPNIDSAMSFTKAPAGPPPSGPLPAVPHDSSPPSSYRKTSNGSDRKKSSRSPNSRVHSRNTSAAHSRNPSAVIPQNTQSSHTRSRNVSDASSMYSDSSSIKAESRPASRDEFGPMLFPPRSSSTRHMAKRSAAAPPRAIDTHRQRQWSRNSIVACAM